MELTLRVWRQQGPGVPGEFEEYRAAGISEDASFLEMLDVVNDRLTLDGREPIAFDHDCREGICGSCGVMINGSPHGPQKGTATCQLHMRKFSDGDLIVVEPWRAAGFPIIKDLVVDRSALDRIIQAGGYIGADVGGAPDANLTLIPKDVAETAMDAAVCIGCGKGNGRSYPRVLPQEFRNQSDHKRDKGWHGEHRNPLRSSGGTAL